MTERRWFRKGTQKSITILLSNDNISLLKWVKMGYGFSVGMFLFCNVKIRIGFSHRLLKKQKKNPNLKATSKMLYNITNKKMRVFLWIWKMIGPLVMIAGAIYTAFVLLNLDWSDDVPLETNTTFIIGGICALVGFILGFTGWAEDVAPRLFWIKGRVELLDNQIGYAITLAIQFFFIPAAIGAIIMLL